MSKVRRIVTGFSVVLLTAPAVVILSMFSSSAFYYFKYKVFLDSTFLAKQIFNSQPFVIYYVVLMVFLLFSLVFTIGKIKNIGIVLSHAAVILIIGSSMAASEKGHEVIGRLFGVEKIPTGEIVIYKGQTEDKVWVTPDKQKPLPFAIRLVNLRIEFYHPGVLHIRNLEGKYWQMPAEPNTTQYLDPNTGMVQVLNVFKNFKVKTENDKTSAYDSPDGGSNPAVRISYTSPRGAVVRKYIYAKFQNPVLPDDKIYVDYALDVKDYFSYIEILVDGKVAASGIVEVNRPFSFGGYHFYQKGYDTQTENFTVLGMVSDTGLKPFYLGCIGLMAGVSWHFWFRHLFAKRKKAEESDAH